MNKELDRAFDQLLWADKDITVGTFTALPEHSNFSDTGPIQGHIIVFANQPVIINKYNKRLIANHNTVMLYNRGDVYTREALTHQGDHAHWISFTRRILNDFNGLCGIDVDQSLPFQISQIGSNSKAFYVQKRLFNRLKKNPDLASFILYDEIALIIEELGAIEGKQEKVSCSQRNKIFKAIEFLSKHFKESIDIDRLAAEIYLSPFHLCRIFKKVTGFSIHQYIVSLRLKEGLNEVFDSSKPLSDIALDLNFASHSHFSSAFKKFYSTSPNHIRK